MDLQLLRSNIEKKVTLPDDAWESMVKAITLRHLKKREIWFQSGEIAEVMGFVLKGCIRTFYTDEKSHEHIVQFAFEDWWVGDLMSFVSQKPGVYSQEALEDTTLAIISKEDYERLLLDHPIFERFFRLLIQNAYVASQTRVISVMSKNAETRYNELIQKNPSIELRVAQHQIASFLGITPEALSRIKRTIIEKSKSQNS